MTNNILQRKVSNNKFCRPAELQNFTGLASAVYILSVCCRKTQQIKGTFNDACCRKTPTYPKVYVRANWNGKNLWQDPELNYHENASSMKSIFATFCFARTAFRTSSLREPPPQQVTTIDPILLSISMLKRVLKFAM